MGTPSTRELLIALVALRANLKPTATVAVAQEDSQ